MKREIHPSYNKIASNNEEGKQLVKSLERISNHRFCRFNNAQLY